MAAKPHRMTPARRAALKKAQAASAAKRRGKGKGKLASANRSASRAIRRQRIATGLTYAAAAGLAGAYAYSHVKRNRSRVRSTDHAHTSMPKMAHPKVGQARVGRKLGNNPSVNQIRGAAHDIGVKMSRRDAARAKQANAAHGTTGSRPHGIGGGRKFVAAAAKSQPGGAAPHSPKKKQSVHIPENHYAGQADRNKRRMRIHHKVGERGMYNAGLSVHAGDYGYNARHTFVAGKHGVVGRR